VLCEKPIALTAAEAELLRTAPKGRLVAEAFMVRHHPQWHEVRKWIRGGSLGRVHTVQVFFSFYLDDPDDVTQRPEWGGGACSISAFTRSSLHDSFSSVNRAAQSHSQISIHNSKLIGLSAGSSTLARADG
jgi:hypothetical protein